MEFGNQSPEGASMSHEALNRVEQIPAQEVFARSGGNAVRKHNALQRFWRDAHVGLQHAIHIPGTVYHRADRQGHRRRRRPLRVTI